MITEKLELNGYNVSLQYFEVSAICTHVLLCDEGHMIFDHVIIGHMIITLCRSVVSTTNYSYIMCDGI